MFSICLVRESVSVSVSLGSKIIYITAIAAVVLTIVSIITVLSIFQISHVLIRPLRKLNTKMREVLDDIAKGKSSGLQPDEDSSFEIGILYTIFRDLIQDK